MSMLLLGLREDEQGVYRADDVTKMAVDRADWPRLQALLSYGVDGGVGGQRILLGASPAWYEGWRKEVLQTLDVEVRTFLRHTCDILVCGEPSAHTSKYTPHTRTHAQGTDGATPLLLAIRTNRKSQLRLLLAQHRQVAQEGYKGQSLKSYQTELNKLLVRSAAKNQVMGGGGGGGGRERSSPL
jgi:hypothetical protein